MPTPQTFRVRAQQKNDPFCVVISFVIRQFIVGLTENTYWYKCMHTTHDFYIDTSCKLDTQGHKLSIHFCTRESSAEFFSCVQSQSNVEIDLVECNRVSNHVSEPAFQVEVLLVEACACELASVLRAATQKSDGPASFSGLSSANVKIFITKIVTASPMSCPVRWMKLCRLPAQSKCLDCDFRLGWVPAQDWPEGSKRPVVKFRAEFPRTGS